MGVNVGLLVLAVAVLATGVLLASARWPGVRDETAPRGRLHQLGWSLALALLALSVVTVLSGAFDRDALDQWPLLLIPITAALLLVFRPRLAVRLGPPGLILLGALGFVLARDYGFVIPAWLTALGTSSAPAPRSVAALPTPAAGLSGTPSPGSLLGSKALTLLGAPSGLVLPLAYLFVLLGVWLTWRSTDPVLAQWRRWFGRLTNLPPRAQLRALLVIPVAIVAIELFVPDNDNALAAVLAIAAPLAAAYAVLRHWPRAAARIASAGLLFLGVAGVFVAITWVNFPTRIYGILALAGGNRHPLLELAGNAGGVVLAQALVMLTTGIWLVPRAFPAAGRLLGLAPGAELTRQVQQLTESRAVAVDTAASDLRRLERDLHDGAQARLVALGMSLRAAERLIPVNPDAALALVAEARDTSARALTELRELVRGVHPPVLADRGLVDAVRALALDCPLAVQTHIDLPGRPPAPVETACYFAVAELLTNATKHSGTHGARVDVGYTDGVLRIEVTDFGLGGADPAAGSGLAGVEKRLSAFDGIMAISSPAGGPTIVVLEVPCALSSPKTSTC
jgi:signal transduction histidine kinase